MLKRVCAVLSVATTAVLLLSGLAAAATPVGNVATANGSSGSCSPCVAVQTATDPGDFSYTIPIDGVITHYLFWAGSSVSPGATVRLQVYRPVSVNSYQLVAQSGDHSYSSSGEQIDVATRLTVTAGDVIGARFSHTSANTPAHFADPASHALNVVGTGATDPAVGDTVDVTPTTTRLLNMAAFVETDGDGDGYGDESQDLCPDNAAEYTDACTGTLVGDPLSALRSGDFDCPAGPDCDLIQDAVPGLTWTVPFDGVILRWRYKDGQASDSYKLRVFRSAGVSGQMTPAVESEPLAYAGQQRIARANVRIGVRAGDRLGLSGSGDFPFYGGSGTSLLADPAPALGAPTATAASGSTGAFLYNADIEPDADHDLWGDLTEDACTTDASRRDDCVAPSISGFRLSNNRFVVDNRGAVAAKKLPKGTVFSLSLDAAAKVKFKIEAAVKGVRRGKSCKKPSKSKSSGRKKPCTLWTQVHDYSVGEAGAGPLSASYSGRYRSGKRVLRLKAGKHRVSAFATDTNNNLSISPPVEFTVAASPKSRSSR